MKTLILNVGLNVNGVQPANQMETTLNELRKLFYGFPYLLTIKEHEGSDWEAEQVAVMRIEGVSLNKTILESLCQRLNQDAIAYEYNGEGGIVFNPNYQGERYKFNPEYFLKI